MVIFPACGLWIAKIPVAARMMHASTSGTGLRSTARIEDAGLPTASALEVGQDACACVSTVNKPVKRGLPVLG